MRPTGHYSDTAPRHLGALFFRRVEELGERIFIKLQRKDRFEEISWKDFGSKVGEMILGLYSLGLREGERVADELERMLWSRVQGMNARLEDYERIRKIAVLRSDFPEKVRSVTAFQKIKVDRNAVEEFYREEIDRIYRES